MTINSRLRRRTGASLLLATALAFGILAVPSVASASGGATYWVNNGVPTVAGNGTSCAFPGYSTIQSAVNVAQTHAAGTITVCPGTYVEQVQITGSHTSLTISALSSLTAEIELPAVPANSTTSCDTAPGTGAYQPDQDGFAVCGTSHTSVTVNGLIFDEAWPGSTCDDSLYGILVGGGSTLTLRHSQVIAAGADPINGCQGGVGIQVGMAWTTPNEVGHAILGSDRVSGYQKNGMTIDGTGSTAALYEDVVQGAGETTQTAQNGIQVSNGAFATIVKTRVSGNECDNATCGANAQTDYQASGLLFYGAKKGSSVTQSTIQNNDIGLYYASEQPTLPTHGELDVTFTTFDDNRYEGVLFDQGRAALARDLITAGNVGVMFLQYDGQSYGDYDQITDSKINNQSVAAVQVDSDLSPTGDKPGYDTFTNCSVNGPVLSNTSSYRLVFRR